MNLFNGSSYLNPPASKIGSVFFAGYRAEHQVVADAVLATTAYFYVSVLPFKRLRIICIYMICYLLITYCFFCASLLSESLILY
ncbi:hypothetical protein C0V77_11650 [Emticicia sp. TH156]|nr:hypothetical protein C0V77_11650 [Emticicia sp. TH156]